VALLGVEDALRRSPATQLAMEDAERSGAGDWIDVATEVQRRVARESLSAAAQGDEARVDRRVSLLRAAALRHPEVAHYVRYNRARRGDVRAGDAAPAVAVWSLAANAAVTLLQREPGDARPLVIVAGSIS